MSKKMKKPKVVTTETAMKMLDCSWPTFIKKYQPLLTQIKGKARAKLYYLDQVQALKDKFLPYEIVDE